MKYFAILTLCLLACSTTTPKPESGIKYQLSDNLYLSHAVVTAETLNVRKSPNGEVLTDFWLYEGERVKVLGREDNWCKISDQQWVACWWLMER